MTITWELDLVQLLVAAIALWALIVAWRQLSTMSLQARAGILLSLDQRWESEPLTSIRALVRVLVDKVAEDARRRGPGLTEAQRRARSAEIYADELQQKRTQTPEEYSRLFQLCGFFETVGYVARAEHIPVADIINLLGGALLMAGMVFKSHIEKLHQEEGGDRHAYEHFLWLLERTEEFAKKGG